MRNLGVHHELYIIKHIKIIQWDDKQGDGNSSERSLMYSTYNIQDTKRKDPSPAGDKENKDQPCSYSAYKIVESDCPFLQLHRQAYRTEDKTREIFF